MTTFNLEEQSYLALVRPEEVPSPEGPLVRAAIYAPGLACADYSDHRDAAALLHYAYLISWQGAWDLLGSGCVEDRYHCIYYRRREGLPPQPHLWKTRLDNRHPLAGMGVPHNWQEQTKRKYWRIVPLMGLIIQVEPRDNTKGMLHSYLHRVTRDKGDLSKRQKRTLIDILRERGADRMDDWPKELKAHYKELKRRRDLAFRLARLADLDLTTEDAKTVSDLREENTAWSKGKMQRLSKNQKGLIRALEAQYLEQRVAAMEALAWRLATRLGETKMLDPRRTTNGKT